jgi:hypothetical protein
MNIKPFTGEYDPEPGDWYIVIVRNQGKSYQRRCIAAGPFASHKAACDMLCHIRTAAGERDGWTIWDTWLTGRIPELNGRPGVLNDKLRGCS